MCFVFGPLNFYLLLTLHIILNFTIFHFFLSPSDYVATRIFFSIGLVANTYFTYYQQNGQHPIFIGKAINIHFINR